MGATIKYPANAVWFRWAMALLLVGFAEVAPAAETNFVAQAEAAYRAAKDIYATNTQSVAAAIAVARTAFDYADLARTDELREQIANHGIAVTRSVIATNTNSAAAHYYLALNIGQLARTKMLGALPLLTEMEKELRRVIQLDRKYDYAGGDRTIGVLYQEAPTWSVGDRVKARTHLEKAVELAPEFPDNHLCYMEGLAKWRDWDRLAERIKTYESMLPTARQKFTGPEWDYEWHDWRRRIGVLKNKWEKR